METVHGRSTKLNSNIHEVVVIGGGIAATCAVVSLAQAGIKSLWLSPAFVDQQHRVGESLAPAANTLLAGLGLSGLLDKPAHRHSNSLFSAWGQALLVERNAAIHLEGAGHVIDRNQFEKDLYQRASEVCAQFIEGNVKSYSVESGVWHLLTEQSVKIRSRFLIDATGRAQKIGKSFSTSHTQDHLIAAYCFLKQRKNSQVHVTPATLIETVETGWWYASLLSSGELTLNYYTDPDLIPKKITTSLENWLALIAQTQHIAYWLDDAEFTVDSPAKISSAASRWLTPAAGIEQKAAWAAIGDAAASFDPLSAHGMTTALWAATRMPELVKKAHVQDYQPLHDYADAVDKGVRAFLDQRKTMYQQETRYAQAPFWVRRQ